MKAPSPISALRVVLETLRPEKVFLLLACSFGLAVLVANPPFQAPDENDHFARIFQLSEGTLVGQKRGNEAGGELPRAAVAVTNTEGIPFHSEKKMTYDLFRRLAHPLFMDWSRSPRAFHNFPHTVVYPPAAYGPQTIAVFLGRHLRIGPLGLMYLARLAAFAAAVALGYAALRVLPIYRWTLLVVLLCPMSLYLFGSLASDGLLIGAAALLLALGARAAVDPGRPPAHWEVATVGVLAGILSWAKPPYLPLAAVALVAIVPRLGSLRRKAVFSAGMAACCLLPISVWGRVAIALFVPGKGAIPIDPVAQSHLILGHPFAFLALVARTIHAQYLFNYHWMVGTLGWGDTPMPGWFYPAFGYGALACMVLESPGAKAIGGRLRGVMIAAAAISVLLIYAALYADWNPPGSLHPIEGIEGRYFLPLLPLVILSFPAVLARSHGAAVAALSGFLSVLCAATCLGAVLFRYYVTPLPSGPVADAARLVSYSAEALVGTQENILVTGITVAGHGQETLLIRAQDDPLSPRGISGGLRHPSLTLLASDGTVLASNTGWRTNSDPEMITSASATVGVSVLPGEGSALVATVSEGNYTVDVSGADGAAALVKEEIYELSATGTRLTHFSSRGYVGRGSNRMTNGFVVRGTGKDTVLVRGVGPGLTQFGVIGALAQPTLELGPIPSGPLKIEAWGKSPGKDSIASAASRAGAFPFAADSADSAAVATLAAGAYRVKVYGVDGTTGIALAEIYELPR